MSLLSKSLLILELARATSGASPTLQTESSARIAQALDTNKQTTYIPIETHTSPETATLRMTYDEVLAYIIGLNIGLTCEYKEGTFELGGKRYLHTVTSAIVRNNRGELVGVVPIETTNSDYTLTPEALKALLTQRGVDVDGNPGNASNEQRSGFRQQLKSKPKIISSLLTSEDPEKIVTEQNIDRLLKEIDPSASIGERIEIGGGATIAIYLGGRHIGNFQIISMYKDVTYKDLKDRMKEHK